MAADYPQAEWHPSPNFWTGRQGSKVDGIILHGTAGGDGPGVAGFLSQSSTKASVHFVIGQDGHVFQLAALADAAWGNGIVNRPSWPVVAENGNTNPNLYTVSIEHCKHSTDNSDALTPAQAEASVALVRWLLAALEERGLASAAFIQHRNAGDLVRIVTSHSAIDGVDRARCPGTFDWDGYYTRVGKGGADMAAWDMNMKRAYIMGMRVGMLGSWPESGAAVEAYAAQITDDGSNVEAVFSGLLRDATDGKSDPLWLHRVQALEQKVDQLEHRVADARVPA
jgi:N-acetyl-anhydromuramyl-L-alanine amidase AmpD